MTKPSTRLALLALLGVMALAACQERVRSSQRAFETDLQALQEYFHIPGMAVLVKKGGVVLHESYLGYADLENEIPVDANTGFPIASVTKTLATVLMMQLGITSASSLAISSLVFPPAFSSP